jgi:hypothetical protein
MGSYIWNGLSSEINAACFQKIDEEVLGWIQKSSVISTDSTHFIHLPPIKPKLHLPSSQPLIYLPKVSSHQDDYIGVDWSEKGDITGLTNWVAAPPLWSLTSTKSTVTVDLSGIFSSMRCYACGDNGYWDLRLCNIKSLRLIIPDERVNLCSECVEHKDEAIYFLTTVEEYGQQLGCRLAEKHIEIVVGDLLNGVATQKELMQTGFVGSYWGANLRVANWSMASA